MVPSTRVRICSSFAIWRALATSTRFTICLARPCYARRWLPGIRPIRCVVRWCRCGRTLPSTRIQRRRTMNGLRYGGSRWRR
uniref:Putative secreted protein n=1 Tax=Anopheles darlingi TaxID=43151 RepID=A0A2M4DPN0_ANODA